MPPSSPRSTRRFRLGRAGRTTSSRRRSRIRTTTTSSRAARSRLRSSERRSRSRSCPAYQQSSGNGVPFGFQVSDDVPLGGAGPTTFLVTLTNSSGVASLSVYAVDRPGINGSSEWHESDEPRTKTGASVIGKGATRHGRSRARGRARVGLLSGVALVLMAPNRLALAQDTPQLPPPPLPDHAVRPSVRATGLAAAPLDPEPARERAVAARAGAGEGARARRERAREGRRNGRSANSANVGAAARARYVPPPPPAPPHDDPPPPPRSSARLPIGASLPCRERERRARRRMTERLLVPGPVPARARGEGSPDDLPRRVRRAVDRRDVVRSSRTRRVARRPDHASAPTGASGSKSRSTFVRPSASIPGSATGSGTSRPRPGRRAWRPPSDG